mmetsp:Transcript_23121/g.33562  ORF Transcript_23121/g.33562 Transcript_23121/m.33562 type:complete len:88 (-) Transcript_23121:62-325(-)
MKSFKTLCVFVSLILAVCASEAIEEPQRRIRGLKGGGAGAPKTSKAPRASKGDTGAPKGSKGGTGAPKGSKGGSDAPKGSKGSKGAP